MFFRNENLITSQLSLVFLAQLEYSKVVIKNNNAPPKNIQSETKILRHSLECYYILIPYFFTLI